MRPRLGTILLLAHLLLTGCYDFNNPADPEADNYQGFPTDGPPAASGVITLWAYAPDREHGLEITWPDNADDEEGYLIERRPAGGSFSPIAKVETDVTSYLDLSLSPDMTYEFRVCAFNGAGASAYFPGPTWTMAPAAVTGLTGIPYTANRIKLDWTDKSTTNDTYIIDRKLDGGVYYEHVSAGVLAADATTWEDTALPGTTPYWYRVYAYRGGDLVRSAGVEIGPITSP